MLKIKHDFTQQQARDAAMCREGVSPALIALKPGVRRQANRTLDIAKGRGKPKHKKAGDFSE